MSCLHFVNLMALAAGGDLEGAELRLLEDHLVGCEACRAFMEELDQSQRALLNLSQVEVSEGMEADLTDRVMRAVAQEPQTVNVRQVWRPVFLWAAAAGFLLAVLAVVVAMTDLRSPPPRTPAVQPETLPQQALNAPAEPSNPPEEPRPIRPNVSSPAPPPEASPPTVAVVARHQSARPKPHPSADEKSSQPLVILLQTEDPNVLIYWIVPAQGGNA